jgi:4-methyl-5(b-hydroxyethyl)-thiazole monophosphate biosynthesis
MQLNKSTSYMKHYVFFANGFEDIEALSVVDVLRRAGVDVKTVSIYDTLHVTSAHGVTIVTDILFSEVEPTEGYLILPGGMPGTTNLAAHSGLCALLQQHHAKGLPLAAICAAPMVLGGLKILEGKKAICYPGCEGGLGGALLQADQKVVQDGNVITGKGPGVSLDFALAIAATLVGEERAHEIGKAMMYL